MQPRRSRDAAETFPAASPEPRPSLAGALPEPCRSLAGARRRKRCARRARHKRRRASRRSDDSPRQLVTASAGCCCGRRTSRPTHSEGWENGESGDTELLTASGAHLDQGVRAVARRGSLPRARLPRHRGGAEAALFPRGPSARKAARNKEMGASRQRVLFGGRGATGAQQPGLPPPLCGWGGVVVHTLTLRAGVQHPGLLSRLLQDSSRDPVMI